MKYLLPIPSHDYIPVLDGSEAFTDMLDKQWMAWYEETIGIEYNRLPTRAPTRFLDVMGEQVGADIQPTDDEGFKRFRIATAQDMNGRRGLWATVKEIIDLQVGGDAKLVDGNIGGVTHYSFDGQGIPDIYNGIQGDMSNNNGLQLSAIDDGSVGGGSTAGIFYIDVDAYLSPLEVTALISALQNQFASYYRIVLGSMQYDGGDLVFVPFSNGGIN